MVMESRSRPATLPLAQTFSQTKVTRFLDSIGRNSRQSKRIYGFGLSHFQGFLYHEYGMGCAIDSIVDSLTADKINVYTLLDGFVSYLRGNGETSKLSPNSIFLYVGAARSYLAYYDIDIVPAKFKRRVKLPKNHREDEQPIDGEDIRRILLSCNNRRLKAYLLVIASGGFRAMEALAIRYCDLDYSASPTKVKVRKEFAKNRVSREVYISDEATHFLKQWQDWKSRRIKNIVPNDLVFVTGKDNGVPVKLSSVYTRVLQEFNNVLKIVGMDERKEGMQRRKITFHSFRRHLKSVLSNQVNTDYSEWFLGDNKSPYYTLKQEQRREIYLEQCMKWLTYLDFSLLQKTSKNIESKLEDREKEILFLRHRDLKHETEMVDMRKTLDKIVSIIQENPKLANVKTHILKEKI